jgi:S1-C subfamily serine protease
MLQRYHEPPLTRSGTGVSIFRRASPSVVLVVSGNVKNEQDVSLGAGVIVDAAGYVLTNWHVIAGYQGGVVFLKPPVGTDVSETNAYAASLVAQNPRADLALLKIVKAPSGLRALPIADISSVEIAEDVHIIGHPHGNLWSYSTGVVSQVRPSYEWSYSDGSKHQAKVLQMQTAINPGNSGGPVLDDTGRILGLVAMSEEGQNLDYAIAADVIKAFLGNALQSRVRGGGPSHLGQSTVRYSAAQRKDGQRVIRAVYSELVAYTLLDPKGEAIGVVAEASDGTTVRAWTPNPLGGFRHWLVRLPDGLQIKAEASGNVLDGFTGSHN